MMVGKSPPEVHDSPQTAEDTQFLQWFCGRTQRDATGKIIRSEAWQNGTHRPIIRKLNEDDELTWFWLFMVACYSALIAIALFMICSYHIHLLQQSADHEKASFDAIFITIVMTVAAYSLYYRYPFLFLVATRPQLKLKAEVRNLARSILFLSLLALPVQRFHVEQASTSESHNNAILTTSMLWSVVLFCFVPSRFND